MFRMKQAGFTLVEMLIVIAIAGILMAIATMNFRQWTIKSNIESQTREMYADIMNARVQAMNRNRAHFLILSTSQYTIKDDTNNSGTNNTGDTTLIQRSLNNQIAYSNTETKFDSRGITYDEGSIFVSNNTVGASYDCIVISRTRINMGQMSGGSCVKK